MQRDEIVLTDPAAARALRETPWLALFLDPASPSEVARTLARPANLMHHHARRLVALGLLVEASRAGGRVRYQLAARTFKFERRLLPVPEAEGQTLGDLTTAFLRAFERSDHLARGQDPDYAVFGFNAGDHVPVQSDQALEAHPPHLHLRTLRLSAGRYQAFVRELYARLAELERDPDPSQPPCTLAVLAFDGGLSEHALSEGEVQAISSFVPLFVGHGDRAQR